MPTKSGGEILRGIAGIQESTDLFAATGWKDSDLVID
jgi:hypothetical protein